MANCSDDVHVTTRHYVMFGLWPSLQFIGCSDQNHLCDWSGLFSFHAVLRLRKKIALRNWVNGLTLEFGQWMTQEKTRRL
jgi:hypothetical protein